MRIQVQGKYWNLKFVRINSEKQIGHCDSPELPNRTIKIDNRLKGEEKLEVIVHELLHAAGWHIDEEFVEQFGIDVARVLWRLGYREQGQ